MQTTTNRRRAFTLMELLLIIGVVSILAAILLPANSGGPHKAKRITCVNYLKQLDLAFKIWADDHTNSYPMTAAEHGDAFRVFQVMSNEINAPKVLFCPADSKGTRATNFFNLNNGNISYFIGLDATEDSPGAVLLGDDDLVVNGTAVRSGILNLSTKDTVEWGPDRHRLAG